MFRSTNTCSVVSLPFICPSCSFLYITCHRLHFLSLSLIILNSIFPATESKVMPLQFLQFLVFPFFASLMISPCLQLLAIFSYCHIFFISWYIFSDENSVCFELLCCYGVIPGTFPFYNPFIAALTLPTVRLFTAISSTVSWRSCILPIISYWVCWCFPIKRLLKVLSPSFLYSTVTTDVVSILV